MRNSSGDRSRRPARSAIVAPEFRVGDRQGHHARVLGGMFGHETEAKPGGDHRQRPVVTIAPVDRADGDALFGEDGIGIAGKFTIVAVYVAFIAHVFHLHATLVGEAVGQMDGHHHLLAEKRQ